MIKVTKALAKQIIRNLKHYFPETTAIKNTNSFDVRELIKNYSVDDCIYGVGNSELYDLCEMYGIKKHIGNQYIDSLINIDNVKGDWPYFKLMLLHNYDKSKDSNTFIWKQIFKLHYEDYPDLIDLAKIVLMIPSNSCAVERGHHIYLQINN